MGNIVIFSLDYDGCGDILFKEQIERKHSTKEFTKERLLIVQQQFYDYLNQLASKGAQVELYVGSTRQSDELNKHNFKKKQNGNCFKNFEQLCKNAVLHGNKIWKYNNLLMGDTLFEGWLGECIVDSSTFIALDGTKPEFVTYPTIKIPILINQIMDIEKNHPKDSVDFYFIDDSEKELQSALDYFSKNKKYIPSNINIHFIKSRWCHYAVSLDKSLASEFSCIQNASELEPEFISQTQAFFKPQESASVKPQDEYKHKTRKLA